MKKIKEPEFKKFVKENPKAIVINVLSEDSFEQEHVPNSINIPVEDDHFVDEVESKIRDKSTPVVVYCAGLSCTASTLAAERLEEAGYKQVFDFKGGMEEWHAAGNKVTAGVS